MADQDADAVNQKIDRVEQKLDALARSVDERFEEVSEHFVEQRQYTELAFTMLRAEMRAGFAEMHSRFEQMDRRMALFIETQGGLNQRFERRITTLERARRRHKSS